MLEEELANGDPFASGQPLSTSDVSAPPSPADDQDDDIFLMYNITDDDLFNSTSEVPSESPSAATRKIFLPYSCNCCWPSLRSCPFGSSDKTKRRGENFERGSWIAPNKE